MLSLSSFAQELNDYHNEKFMMQGGGGGGGMGCVCVEEAAVWGLLGSVACQIRVTGTF